MKTENKISVAQSALETAVDIAGTQKELARRITEHHGREITQPYISRWMNDTKRVPAEYVLAVEKAVQGQVTRHQLRPDLYPKE